MRKQAWMVAMALVICGIGSAALGQADKMLGSWVGRWEGGGAGGRFDLTLQKSGDALAGEVSVGQDQGDYVAKFTKVSLDANKLSARYDYPPDGQAEIILDATFDGAKASGTWALVAKGAEASTAFANGTWNVSKK